MRAYYRIGGLQVLNILSFIAVVVINGLADFLPINGQTTGAVSNQYPNEFTPAPVTFSIWALIYSLLFLFCIYQGSTLFETARRTITKKEMLVDRIGYLFILSCVLNCCWILAWHYHLLFISVLIMLGLLITLIRIFRKLHNPDIHWDQQSKWFVYVPFSIYLGWISVATIANITAWLVGTGWSGGSIAEWIWACAMVLVAFTLAMTMLLKRGNIFFALVIVWACCGIALRQHNVHGGLNNVAVTALCAAGALLLLAAARWHNIRTVFN